MMGVVTCTDRKCDNIADKNDFRGEIFTLSHGKKASRSLWEPRYQAETFKWWHRRDESETEAMD